MNILLTSTGGDFMKRAISLFMSIAMLVSAVLYVDLSAYASELSINNRAAWLSTLVSTFDMTLESDNYPDNYFSDLTEDSEYYRDIFVATEYGLISVEAGDPIYPKDDITKEYAAQTLNACLGFQLETNEDGEYDYTFADFRNAAFPMMTKLPLTKAGLSWWTAIFVPTMLSPQQKSPQCLMTQRRKSSLLLLTRTMTAR